MMFQVIYKQYEPLNSIFDKMIPKTDGEENQLCDILLKELGVGELKVKNNGKETKPSDNIQGECDFG